MCLNRGGDATLMKYGLVYCGIVSPSAGGLSLLSSSFNMADGKTLLITVIRVCYVVAQKWFRQHLAAVTYNTCNCKQSNFFQKIWYRCDTKTRHVGYYETMHMQYYFLNTVIMISFELKSQLSPYSFFSRFKQCALTLGLGSLNSVVIHIKSILLTHKTQVHCTCNFIASQISKFSSPLKLQYCTHWHFIDGYLIYCAAPIKS